MITIVLIIGVLALAGVGAVFTELIKIKKALGEGEIKQDPKPTKEEDERRKQLERELENIINYDGSKRE
ncbi:MAG: hypothetical protein IJV67_02600 [Clostridia bacterium]|nr:hypothetical protein [Clostridia bacterium]